MCKDDKIIEVNANPKEASRDNEHNKFQFFKKILKYIPDKVVDLIGIAGEGIAHKKDAEAKRTYAEAQKIIEEAGEIAAKKEISTECFKLEKHEKLNSFIDDIFKEGQNPKAQSLKLSLFLKEFPDIANALEEYKDFSTKLSYEKNCTFSISDKKPMLDSGSPPIEESEIKE